MFLLWFDVEEGYNPTLTARWKSKRQLWFDVEEGYNPTRLGAKDDRYLLWFDVEEGYNPTQFFCLYVADGCGLM